MKKISCIPIYIIIRLITLFLWSISRSMFIGSSFDMPLTAFINGAIGPLIAGILSTLFIRPRSPRDCWPLVVGVLLVPWVRMLLENTLSILKKSEIPLVILFTVTDLSITLIGAYIAVHLMSADTHSR
jgi:hypothetical protein